MKITFDPAKRAATLQLRSLDFADASLVFAGPVLEIADNRQDYGEVRIQTIGYSRWAAGDGGLDAARQGTAHCVDEVLQ